MSTIHNVHSTIQLEPVAATRPWPPIAQPAPITDDATGMVFIIDSSEESRESLCHILRAQEFQVQAYSDIQSFLSAHKSGRRGCLLVDVSTPGAGGIALIRRLKSHDGGIAAIAIAQRFAPARVVEAMKAGASDCLDRSASDALLVSTVERVMEEANAMVDAAAYRSLAIQRVDSLTPRQREILDLITMGHPSKNIAADLQISQRTVENHRAAIARKTCSKSLSDVVHTAICANCSLMQARH